MTPERQKILAEEILNLSQKIDKIIADNGQCCVDMNDYYTIQDLASVLARSVLGAEEE
jgi:hypothetical protein